MDASKLLENAVGMENTDTLENCSSTGSSKPGSKPFFHRFLCYYLLGSGENVLTNLACVNTVYLLLVFWFVFFTSLLYTPLIRNKIELALHNCRANEGGERNVDCEKLESVESITLRFGFTFVLTFIILALVAVCLRSKEMSSHIHQGFWLAKFLLIFILLSACLMIPVGHFDRVWSALCFLGSLVFCYIETVLILDFATTVSDVFVLKITEERSRLHYVVWLVLVWLTYLLAFVFSLLLFTYFTGNCGLSAILVTSVFLLCTLLTLITVYFSEKRTGFLHSGFGTLYILLLTLVTLKHKRFCLDKEAATSSEFSELSNEVLKYLEIVLAFLLLTYAALRNYSEKYYHIGTLTVSCHLVAREKDESVGEDTTSNAQHDTTIFTSSVFFAVLCVFAFFVTSKLTSLKAYGDDDSITRNSTIFHLRSLTIILIVILMIWSQVFPIIYQSENPYDLWALGKTFVKSQLKLYRRILIEGFPCSNGPVASRRIFMLLYILGVLFSCMVYLPEIRHSLSRNTYFCTTISTQGVCLSTDPAYMAVYRVCVAMATFYLLFAIILICVECTSDPRVDIQYKSWPVKICLFFSLLLGSFLLPQEFSRVWIYAALTGTFVFTILQLILLMHWTKSTTKKLYEKMKSSYSQFWPMLLIFLTIFMIFLSLGAVVVLYLLFSKFQRCATNVIFITFNLILIVVASVTSVHPKIYDAGLFQCYVIVIFSLYLTWSGLSHNPDENCNPFAGYIAEVDMRPNLNIQAGIDLLFTFITVIFFSSRAPDISEQLRKACDSLPTIYDNSRRRKDSTAVMELSSKQDFVSYHFTLFHGVYFFASLHATIILTNWFIPATGSHFKLSVNWAAMCVKLTCSNLSLVIYVWIIATQLFTK